MINIKKIIYFILAIIILILISLITLNHLNNKEFVTGIIKEKEEPKKVLKTIVDEESNIEICYSLSKEINDTDKLIIKEKTIPYNFKKKNVIKYFSISLYDEENIKKSFIDSEMTINITLSKELKKYDELKVVRINNKYQFTDEEFDVIENDNKLIFVINRSSKYGIVGIKYSKQK